ncbi:MAG: hypothetical protein AAB131_19110 [Actinomycetota bacterium]
MGGFRSALRSAWTWAIVLVAVSAWWGTRLQREHPEVFLGAAPLVGRDPTDGWQWRFGWGLVGAAAVGGTVILGTARSWWWRVRLRWLVPATGAAAGLFATLLALTDGTDGLLHGATDRTEYMVNLDIAPPAGQFLRHFVADIDQYSVHVRGHPPGFVLVLKALDNAGLDGAWPVVALSIIGTVALPIAVLVAVWAVAGHEWARRSAPLLIVAPYALWMVTSADAVYTAVGASGVALFAIGLRTRSWRACGWGSVSGTMLGSLLFLTYGGAMFVLVPAVPAIVAIRRRRPGAVPTLAGAVLAGAAVTALFAVGGFWWFDGANATRHQYWSGTAQFRPFAYFAVANLAASLIAIGPATFAGLLRMWKQRSAPAPIVTLVAGGALALLAAHASQYSRAEVERIWLLFFPWLVVAGSVLVSRAGGRLALAAVGSQAVAAIVLQAALVSKW